MRIVQAAVLTLLVAGAVPSVGFGQIVIPYTNEWKHADRLDHALPVATVIRPGDAIALADPIMGDGFVLGAAKLDLKDPDHPMIVFPITNGRGTPIPLSSVMVLVHPVNERVDDRKLLFVCGYSGWLTNIMMVHHAVSEDTTLRPGATVTVAMPVGPHCHPYADGRQPGPRVGFLVHLIQNDDQALWGDRPPGQVGGPTPLELAEKAFLRIAFEKLRALSQQ